MSRRARAAPLAAAAAAALALATALGAQERSRGRVQPEARVDATAARDVALHAAAGASVPVGRYVRTGLTAGAGAVWRERGATASGRAELVSRFLFDPFRAQRWAPYAAAGVSVRAEGRREWDAFLALAIGLEGPPLRGTLPAVEVGVGGGVRVAVVVRRALEGRR